MTDRTERGCFISLEGGEGTGKTTQIAELKAHLVARGLDVITTREPGGTPAAEAIRSLLVSGEVDRWTPMSEALLLYAARHDHYRRTIEPALVRGYWVISDRFADSTMAYQGLCQGLGAATVDALHATVLGNFEPDLTLILDLPVEVALTRANHRNSTRDGETEDRYERMGIEFHERLRQAFLTIAADNPGRCRVIDADGTPEIVADRIRAMVNKALDI